MTFLSISIRAQTEHKTEKQNFPTSIRVFCKKHKGSTTMHKTQEYEAFLVRQDALPEGCSSQIPNGKNGKNTFSSFFEKNEISKKHSVAQLDLPEKRGSRRRPKSRYQYDFSKLHLFCFFGKIVILHRWQEHVAARCQNAAVQERAQIKFCTGNWDFIFHFLAAQVPGLS